MDLAFAGPGIDEAFHVRVDVAGDAVLRWGVSGNVTQEVEARL